MEPAQPVPPHSKAAEEAVLGAALRDPECLADLADIVSGSDFYYPDHGLLFSLLVGLRAARKPVDLVTVYQHCVEAGHDDVATPSFLAELWEAVPTAANAAHHAEIVRDHAVRRAVIHACAELTRDAYAQAGPAAELAVDAARRLGAAGDRFSSPSVASLADVLDQVVSQIDLRSKRPALQIERPTGFIDLDQQTAGLHECELITVGARPGVGKSAFALAVAEAVARAGRHVLFLSLEMAATEQGGRLMVAASGVANERVRRGRVNAADVEALATAHAALRDLPVTIDDDPNQTAVRIVATARKLHRKSPLGLIVIDYLQLIRPTDRRQPRYEQVAEQTRELKLLAKDLKVPVMLLAQLNRESEKDNRRPRLSDLKESGAIEQDSDTVLLLHPESEPTAEGRRLIEVCVAKQRNGPLGVVTLVYEGKTFKFSNWMAGP